MSKFGSLLYSTGITAVLIAAYLSRTGHLGYGAMMWTLGFSFVCVCLGSYFTVYWRKEGE